MIKGVLILIAVCLTACAAAADVVTTTSGRRIEGVILQESASSVLVKQQYGTLAYPRSQIASIERTPESATRATTRRAESLPAWDEIIRSAATQRWASDFLQIPATVVDKGIMRAVPYQSYRIGDDRELNIYGDPDAPAGVEVGLYRDRLRDGAAKAAAVDLVASWLFDRTAADSLRRLDRRKGSARVGGLTLEVTPETDEDAYGSWWVSVYDESALDRSRATAAELAEITQARVVAAAAADRLRAQPTTRRSADGIIKYHPPLPDAGLVRYRYDVRSRGRHRWNVRGRRWTRVRTGVLQEQRHLRPFVYPQRAAPVGSAARIAGSALQKLR